MIFTWDPYSIVAVGIGAMAIQAVFFLFAASFRTDKVTDLSYSLSFVVLAVALLVLSSEPTAPRVLVTAAIVLWGARLGTYLLARVIRTGRDVRFDSIRDRVLRFAGFWLLQGVTVWVVMLPAAVLNSAPPTTGLHWATILGGSLWLLGFIIEALADAQKYRFRSNAENEGRWVNMGLWRYSRHPNYFGEMLCWWGIWIVSLRALSGWLWLTALSPFFLTLMLLFVTGIPTVEKRASQKYGEVEEYREYRRTTNSLVPGPRRR